MILGMLFVIAMNSRQWKILVFRNMINNGNCNIVHHILAQNAICGTNTRNVNYLNQYGVLFIALIQTCAKKILWHKSMMHCEKNTYFCYAIAFLFFQITLIVSCKKSLLFEGWMQFYVVRRCTADPVYNSVNIFCQSMYLYIDNCMIPF